MEYYKLRVDISTINKEDVKNLLVKYVEKFCYCYEGEDTNPHMHMYLEMSTKEATFRANLRKLGLKGNGSYSLKTVEQNPIEYLAYMLKDGDFHNHNIDQSIIDQAVEHNNKVVDDIKMKKEAKRKVVDILTDIVDDLKLDYDDMYHDCRPIVINAIMSYHISKGILIREFQIIAYVHTILCRLSERYRYKLEDEIFRKLI